MIPPEIDINRLNTFAEHIVANKKWTVGYPINQVVELKDFYEWYVASGLADVAMNNVGNPQKESIFSLNTHEFENEVIDYFAPFYGFKKDDVWGVVTNSGTDGNLHGLYFGVKYLLSRSPLQPILYVSEDAHYSIHKLGDLQNLDMRLIPANIKGEMDITAFEAALDPTRPALVALAMGTTFKGGIDDQVAINEILKKKNPPAIYLHCDAALFGGYLAFSDHANLVNQSLARVDSIAFSGHKFFGFDEPLGIFLTRNEVLAKQNPLQVQYLNDAVPTIFCSRSALSVLKFWWKIHSVGTHGFRKQSAMLIRNAEYLKEQLDKIHYPAWKNDFSNTVYLKRPNAEVMKKWGLAPCEDPRLGGQLAHDVVMRHEGKKVIDLLIKDLQSAG